ncbi:hypothetical protein cce_0592 [Crocosphaera subtropica ATCC 51142]|uniref:Uncharacterized protein cyr0024 n=1 Tax=Crocosphaera subtropica (strain ATCC 51142 / BH68) TaxID=43989 RepID=A1KYG8_CROS5|nr:hypothetical protein [Crocosphaera subtropica]AAW57021.1 hypothetical protein [Crocosphaera subtropica ATCC 51142]ACB49943.1 hypothetical protein cce_0592 [Crocosphaera subtropica ATCC 51142]
MSNVQVSICVDDAHLSKIEQIAQKLQSSGMTVTQTLANIGIINGSISSEQLNHVAQIEGVETIERQQTYQLNPPSSHIQ